MIGVVTPGVCETTVEPPSTFVGTSQKVPYCAIPATPGTTAAGAGLQGFEP
jgi:hypothetical protein